MSGDNSDHHDSPDNPLDIRFFNAPEPVNKPLHGHDEGQLYLLEQGVVVCKSSDCRWLIAPQQLGWIPPHTVHGAQVISKASGTLAYLKSDYVQRMPDKPTVFVPTPLIRASWNRLVDGHRSGQGSAQWSVQQTRLLEVMIDELEHAPRLQQQLPMPSDARLNRLAHKLLKNLVEDYELDALADEFGFSRRTLTRRFMQETGLTISQWRQQAKLLNAMERLAVGESITSTAFNVGYQSVSTFCSLFRKYYLQTPKDYQKAAKLG